MKTQISLLFLILFTSFPLEIRSQTIVGGVINTNTTWNLAGSPYIVSGQNILVTGGVTLTIDAGVTVKFDTTRAIQIDGTLRAIGTSAQPITFTANSGSPQPGFWGFILLNNISAPYDFSTGTGSILQYCTIEYAGGVIVSNNGALRLDNARPYIDNCTFRYNNKQVVKIFNLTGNVYINNCDIQNNTADTGIVYARGTAMARVTITNSTISNNISTLASSNDFKTGGVYSTVVNMSIKNCIISNNEGNGMMAYNQIGIIDTISNSTITYNTNGIYYYSYLFSSFSNNTFTITGNIVNNNAINGIYYGNSTVAPTAPTSPMTYTPSLEIPLITMLKTESTITTTTTTSPTITPIPLQQTQ